MAHKRRKVAYSLSVGVLVALVKNYGSADFLAFAHAGNPDPQLADISNEPQLPIIDADHWTVHFDAIIINGQRFNQRCLAILFLSPISCVDGLIVHFAVLVAQATSQRSWTRGHRLVTYLSS